MEFIDSHQHFWQYSPAEHTWISGEMPGLKRDFMPAALAPLLDEINFAGSIAVQARQSVEETDWLLKLAAENDFIKGVVGWVDLRSPRLHEVLNSFAGENKLVGVRHVVHDEPDLHFMLQPAFQDGIAALRDYNLTYDLLLFPQHIPVAVQLVARFPDQPFVVDHIAKPSIRSNGFTPWHENIVELAKFPNVYCKLSGMVTEAKWNDWKEDDFKVYLDTVTAAFGTDRVMIGSDWPVCTLSGKYTATMNIVINFARQFSEETRNAILGGNCIRFYKTADRVKV